MTIVNIDVKDLGGVARPADRIVFRAPTHRADGDRVVSTAAHTVMLDAGVGSADLVPGPAVVKIHCEGVTDTGEKQILVPEDGPVELADLLEASYVYSPAVVSQVAGLVSDAELAAAAAWEAVDTPGRQGPPGAAVKIVSQVTMPDNSVQVTFSDDSVLTVPAGLQGVPGEPGAPGVDGAPGLNGVDGVDGVDGDLSPEDRALVVAATGHAADAAQSAADALVSAGLAEDSAQAAAQSAVDAAESVTSGLADGSVTRAKLAAEVAGELDGKAPVVHEHAMAQISDLPEVAQLATGDALVRRWIDGSISVPLSPDDPADATSKFYVDSAVADAAGAVSSVNAQTGDVVLGAADVGAAPASHTHVIGDVGGLSAALDGKASTSHTHVVADVSDATAVGRSVVTASSAAAARSAIGAGTSSLALGTGAGQAAAGDHSHTAASVGAAPATHPHTMEQITGLGPALEGKAATDHTHTPSSLGAAPAHVEVTGAWPTTGVAGVLYWKAE